MERLPPYLVPLGQAILQAAVDAIAIIDQRGIVHAVNPALERLFGYAREEAIGRNVKLLMPEPFRGEHDGYLTSYLETGRARIIGIGREVVGRRRNGTTFPMHLSVAEVEVDGHRYFAGTMHDLSATKNLEAQLLQSQKLEAIGTLAGGVAHDFNNLLTSILGSAELAQDFSGGDPVPARCLERIRLSAMRGSALTKQLLAFSRSQVTKPELLDLNDAVREARELFERLISEEIAVALDLDAEAGAVRIDPSQLDQVIINLVVNARDAMPHGGRLSLSTRAEFLDGEPAAALEVSAGLYAVLSIGDTGTGIPPDVQRRMFEPFFTTKGPGRGTGLGLPTVRGIIEHHGGAIDFRSRLGEGTTFRIVLPRLAEEAPVAPGPPPPKPTARLAGKTILLVEDDPLMRELLREVLGLQDYQVLSAERPDGALELAAGQSVDLVITDVVMPQMTGFELARRMRADGREPRVIFMSGYTDQILADRGELGPEDLFLRKPFAIDDLTALVAEALSVPSSD
jgi:hypothetical protein